LAIPSYLPETGSAAGLSVDCFLNENGEATDTVAINNTSDSNVIIFRNCIFFSPDIDICSGTQANLRYEE
jgi:hypothetical protein